MTEYLYRAYSRARIDDRAVNELLGIAHGLMADGKIDQVEAEYLRKWLTNNAPLTDNPVIGALLSRVSSYLSDGVLDEDEALDLFETLRRFTGGQSHLDGLQRSSELPIDQPQPVIRVDRSAFCFTGTFAFGSRKDCAAAVVQFEVIDEEGDLIGTVGLPVPPQKSGTIDAMVAAAHHHMKDIVRQWLHRIDQMAGVYDKRQ